MIINNHNKRLTINNSLVDAKFAIVTFVNCKRAFSSVRYLASKRGSINVSRDGRRIARRDRSGMRPCELVRVARTCSSRDVLVAATWGMWCRAR